MPTPVFRCVPRVKFLEALKEPWAVRLGWGK
jgi:hypothetical protein